MKKRAVTIGWLILGGALVLRIGWVLYRWNQQGPALEFDDEALHWQLATNLVERGELVSDDGRYVARMPLYPLFLSLFAGLGQIGILWARLAQALLGAATVGVVYRFAHRAFGPRSAIVTGVLAACDPYSIFFCNLLLTEVSFMLIAVGLTVGAWQLLTHGGRITAIGVGLLGAAALMTRPSAAGWILLLWLIPWIAERNRRRGTLNVAVCAGVLVLLMLPWGLRNRAVVGAWAWLSANGGVTLYDAQGPQADGSSNQAFVHELPELAGLDEIERDRTLQRLALEQMRADPARVAKLAWIKFRRTWNPIPNVAEYRAAATAIISAVFTGVVLLLALGGLWRAVANRRGEWYSHILIWLPVVYFTIVHCVYIGSLRYRVPLMPFLELAAGAALMQYQRRRLR
ncbi:MAG: glycosyltransferase family 39 protein [Planctomycetota bacterium]